MSEVREWWLIDGLSVSSPRNMIACIKKPADILGVESIHVVPKADLDALREKYDRYHKSIFEYAHENVSGDYVGLHIAEALVREHKLFKQKLQDKDQQIEDLEAKYNQAMTDWSADAIKKTQRIVELEEQISTAPLFSLGLKTWYEVIEDKDAEIARLRGALNSICLMVCMHTEGGSEDLKEARHVANLSLKGGG